MNLRIIVFLPLCIIFFTGSSQAQKYLRNAENFNINDGLSQNAANCIIQDNKGYIWIGTQDGLNKFDGYRFTVYRGQKPDKTSLSDNLIYSLCTDGDSGLWIATQRGLSRYRYKTNDFETFKADPDDAYSLYTNSVRTVFTDSRGTLWVKSERGLDRYRHETGEFVFFQHPFDEFSFTAHYNNFDIAEDSAGNIWTATKDGAAKFDAEAEQYFMYYPEGETGGENNEVFSLCIDRQNNILVGTVSGIFLFDDEKHRFKQIFKNLKNETITEIFQDSKGQYWIGTFHGLFYAASLSSQPEEYNTVLSGSPESVSRITEIFEDRSQVLWVSGEDGVFKMDLKPKKFKLYRKAGKGSPEFSSNRIFSVLALDNARILLGTRKFGLNLFNRKTGNVQVFTSQNSGLTDDNIHTINRDNFGNILLGTENGIFQFDPKAKKITSFSDTLNKQLKFRFRNNRVADILHDRKNRYWAGTFNGLYLIEGNAHRVFNNNDKSFFIAGNEVLDILQRKNGEIWAATNKGLAKYDSINQTFLSYNEDIHGLSHFSVLSVYESQKGTLWAGTEYGLNRYEEKADTFRVYNSGNVGFANDFIYCIQEDNKQRLWLSSNKGLIRFNPARQRVKNFHFEDGLQSYEFNVGASYQKEDGEIFFGGIEGFNAFYPDSVQTDKYAPRAIFTGLEVLTSEDNENKVIGEDHFVKLDYDERSFTLYFSMPEYTHVNKNTYTLMIRGFNNKWQDIGTHNFYTVSQIPPGDYRVMVKAFNSDGVESSKPATLRIYIPAPWWMTIWAYIGYGIIIISILTWSFLRYNRQVRRENRILTEKQKTAKKIEHQKELLSIKNKNISDSILYAKRIIDAMMPSDTFIKRLIPHSFVFFMPKDIVSGDFYWIDIKDDVVYVAVVDCTGHGVPGAFMSIVGLNLLRDILTLGVERPAAILDRMSRDVREIFSTEEDNKQVRDGMDMTICAIDRTNKRLEFAGAKNPLYLIRNDRIIEYKGDRFSVGPGSDDGQKFKNHLIEMEDDDMIYMFSDGYADQFGGPKAKKFKYRRFRSVLLDIYTKRPETQKKELQDIITRWKAGTEQVDDMLVMGIRPMKEPG